MRNKYFNNVVKKILKYKGKLISLDKLKINIESILAEDYSDQKVYKIVYYLKNRGYLLSLKKDIYIVKSPDVEYDKQELIDMFYWNILKKHCKSYLDSDWYIGGIKALELNMSSYVIPDNLLVVNRYKQSSEVLMFDKKIIFKKYYSEDKKMFGLFLKFTKKIYIKNNVFKIANLELSIVESLYNTPLLSQVYVDELIKKVIRQSANTLDIKIWGKILMNNKHHSSINRLYKISQSVDPVFSEKIKNIIKKYSYFIQV